MEQAWHRATNLRVAHVLAAAAAVAPALAALAPLGLAPLLVVAALAALALRIRHAPRRPWRLKPLAALFALLVAFGLVSAIWSIGPAASIRQSLQLLAVLACGWVLLDAAVALGHEDRRRVGDLLVAGITVAIGILAVERVADFPIRRLTGYMPADPVALLTSYKRGLTVLVLLVWPAALVLWCRQRASAALLAVAVLGILLVYDGGSARFAALLALVVAGAAMLAARAVARTLAALLVVYIAAAPLLHLRLLDAATLGIDAPKAEDAHLGSVPRSGYHRLLIWHFAAVRIAERPVLGWGLDAARAIPGGDRLLDRSEQAMPLHPHNVALQVWLELGLPGAVLLGMLVGWTMGRVNAASWPRVDKAAALGLAAATAAVANLSYGIWQSWWLAAMLLTAAFGAAVLSGASRDSPDG